jgi:spermidine/putrescine transport system ATP-binding protein
MVIQSTKAPKTGEKVGMSLDPDGIHIMIAEDHTTCFETAVSDMHHLDFNGESIRCDLSKIIPGATEKDGVILNAKGEEIDLEKIRVLVSIQPGDIELSDNAKAGLVSGNIINLIYKGDHYSYVVRTEHGHDLIVDDEYLWNMGDKVGLVMPEDKMTFTLKK